MVVLMMLSTQLKDLAKEYNIFIFSSTQVNSEAMNSDGFKDETSIRSAKSIIDKIDAGAIIVAVDDKQYNSLCASLRQEGKIPNKRIPTHRFDIYKMRRGQYKNISVWSYINLGTGEREDLYVTTASGKLLTTVEVLNNENYREEICSFGE